MGLKLWGSIIVIGMILGALGTVKVHLSNDAKTDVELSEAKAKIVTLEESNKDADSANELLTERIKTHNAEKLVAVAQAQLEQEKAQESVATVEVEKAIIKEQLAVANFAILEAMRDDEDYKDWGYEPAHITALMQLRDIEEGNNNLQAPGMRP